jgi:hypothetical protein
MPVARGRTTRWLTACGLTVACALLAAACTAGSSAKPLPTTNTAVTQWMRTGGSTQITTLATDFSTLGTSADTEDASMAAGCRHLLIDVQAAQAFPAIPDALTQQDWTTALALYSQAATDCATGATTHNYTLVIQASGELNRGTAAIQSVASRLHLLMHQ